MLRLMIPPHENNADLVEDEFSIRARFGAASQAGNEMLISRPAFLKNEHKELPIDPDALFHESSSRAHMTVPAVAVLIIPYASIVPRENCDVWVRSRILAEFFPRPGFLSHGCRARKSPWVRVSYATRFFLQRDCAATLAATLAARMYNWHVTAVSRFQISPHSGPECSNIRRTRLEIRTWKLGCNLFCFTRKIPNYLITHTTQCTIYFKSFLHKLAQWSKPSSSVNALWASHIRSISGIALSFDYRAALRNLLTLITRRVSRSLN